jgi:alpha-1,2-mannosyltransferase
MLAAQCPDVLTNLRNRATAWPYVSAVVAAAALVAYLSFWGQRYGTDLKVYRDAVSSWESGRNPYLLTFTGSALPFTYPPFALIALWPLAWAPFPVTQWLLWAASLATATGAVVLVLRDTGAPVTRRLLCKAFTWACVALIALEPARSATDYGQVELILMVIVTADLLTASRYRGIGTGLAAAVKLTPLAFVIILAVSRDTKSVIRATATFLVCTGLPWLLRPRLSGVFWFRDVSDPGRVGTVTYAANQCWYAILHRPPFPASGSEPAWLLLSLMTLASGAFIAWRCVNAGRQAPAVLAMALASLLASPISWTHHWIWVLLIPALMPRHRTSGIPRPVRIMLWGLLALTIAAPYWWFTHGIAADAAEAALPAWTAAVLLVWTVTASVTWRRNQAYRLRQAGNRAHQGVRDTAVRTISPGAPGPL